MYNSDFIRDYPIFPDIIPRRVNFSALRGNDDQPNEIVYSYFSRVHFMMDGLEPKKSPSCKPGVEGIGIRELPTQTYYCGRDGVTKILAGGRTFPIIIGDGELLVDTVDSTQQARREEIIYEEAIQSDPELRKLLGYLCHLNC
jgi:hypothetical protein